VFINRETLSAQSALPRKIPLKLAYLPLNLHFSGKYLFEEHQISVQQLSGDISLTKMLYCLNRDEGNH